MRNTPAISAFCDNENGQNLFKMRFFRLNMKIGDENIDFFF